MLCLTEKAIYAMIGSYLSKGRAYVKAKVTLVLYNPTSSLS